MGTPTYDLLDRRVLAMLTFTDALGAPVLSPVSVVAEGVRSFAKRPGAVVITEAPGFGSYTAAFDPISAAPAVGSVTLQLDIRPADPALSARRAGVALPRDPDPTHSEQSGSLFRPIEVQLLPTPLTQGTGLTAAMSVTVRRADDNRRVEGALVRLRPEGGRPEMRATTDAAGEALLLVPGVPLASPGAGAVVRPDIAADLDAVIDPLLARFHRDDQLVEAREAARRRVRDFIDPDDLARRLSGAATPAQVVRVGAGRTHTATIAWTP
jgi:hypothetical protein